ncbi:MAG TPA: aminoacyl-tRNA hydrolase [Candidatus Omnitrophota bacterium]|nr:aminoacyl-tRNA hydrolase [Candidatus Omnitrophota bacterium]
MHIIVGLGNPGKEYETTRHNVGFLAVEEIAKRLGLSELKSKSKHSAYIGEAEYEGHKVVLAQPDTYMNNSGVAVSLLLNWHKIDPSQTPDKLIVIYDDVDLERGQVRVRQGGGAGGHHGVESVMLKTGNSDFVRVRVGIGRESPTGDVSSYVLGKISAEERELLAPAIEKAADAALAVVARGIQFAMNRFNA